MSTFIAAFVVLLLAVTGMAIGLIVRGQSLSRSCGGVDPNGEPLGDCLCAKEGRPDACAFEPSEEVPAAEAAAELREPVRVG